MDVPIQNSSLTTHGRAALILVESLMHCLVEKDIISRKDFTEIVDGAAEVEIELENASTPHDMTESILYPLATVFRNEMGR